MNYGYIRISTDKQDADNQRYEIECYCVRTGVVIDEWLEEQISSRKEYTKRLLSKLVEKTLSGDLIICTEISRIGRSVHENFSILEKLVKKKVIIRTIRDGYNFDDSLQSTILAFTFSLAAQIEREQISQRTKHGLALKRAQGVILGRPKGSKSNTTKLTGREVEIKDLLRKKISFSAIGRLVGADRNTVSKFIRENNLQIK